MAFPIQLSEIKNFVHNMIPSEIVIDFQTADMKHIHEVMAGLSSISPEEWEEYDDYEFTDSCVMETGKILLPEPLRSMNVWLETEGTVYEGQCEMDFMKGTKRAEKRNLIKLSRKKLDSAGGVRLVPDGAYFMPPKGSQPDLCLDYRPEYRNGAILYLGKAGTRRRHVTNDEQFETEMHHFMGAVRLCVNSFYTNPPDLKLSLVLHEQYD